MTNTTRLKGRALAALLSGMLLLGGCKGIPPAPAEQTPLPGAEAPMGEAEFTPLPEIFPGADESMIEQREVSLYFRMRGVGMLARETRTIVVPHDKQLAEVLIQALIEGPDAALLELTGLFIPGTRVEYVYGTRGLLTVTLSHEFLGAPVDAPDSWQQDPAWRAEVLLRRRLALFSIVNAITEATEYTAVQFLVLEKADSTNGQRILRSELYEGVTGGSLVTPMSRNEQVLLTHYNTAGIVLESWRNKDFEHMYRFLSGKPTEAAYLEEMASYGELLTDYTLSAGTVSDDGQSAVMVVSLQMTDANGSVWVRDYPMHLAREHGMWKIAYPALTRMMEAR